MFSGYITRKGEFIDVSGYKTIPDESAHSVFCDAYEYVEEELMEVKGWVKLTTCLPHKYIYMMSIPLSNKQYTWLIENNFKVWDEDCPL